MRRIETGIEYYYKRTSAWDWFGEKRWWEIFIEFSGFNGTGGCWIIERWRWNNSKQIIIEQIETLPYQETKKLIKKIASKRSYHNGRGMVIQRQALEGKQ